MSYADAINAHLQEMAQQMQDLGGFVAQAGMTLEECGLADDENARIGYAKQLEDFPNG